MTDITAPLTADIASRVDKTDPVRRDHALGSRIRQLEQLVLSGEAAHTADIDMGGFKITELGTPTASTDAATKAYVDATAIGLDWKPSVRVATAASLPSYTRTGNVITASSNGALAAVDGVTLVAGDRLLLKNGAAGADNGIYVVTTLGTGSVPFVLTRATDADTSAEVTSGFAVQVSEGTVNAGTGWALTTADTITLNTTALTFTQVTGDFAALDAIARKRVWMCTAGTADNANGTFARAFIVPTGDGITVTGIKAHAVGGAPASSGGTYLLAVSGAGNTLLASATFDLETLTGNTSTDLSLTATTADLSLVEDDIITLTATSNNADLTGSTVVVFSVEYTLN